MVNVRSKFSSREAILVYVANPPLLPHPLSGPELIACTFDVNCTSMYVHVITIALYQNPRNVSLCSVYPCEKSKKTFLFFSLEFKLELELELGWKLE